jgi:integrase
MEKSFGLFFHLKMVKKFDAKELPVYLRITVDGKICEVSLKRKCPVEEWNVPFGRMNGKGERPRELNSFLDAIERRVYSIKKQLIEDELPVTAEIIKSALTGEKPGAQKRKLMEIFRECNDQMKQLVGREFTPATYKRYETSYRHTLSFLQSKYGVNDIALRDLNYNFLESYEYWLKATRKCNHNSTIKYLTNFRKVVNRCIRNGWLQKDPFFGFVMRQQEVERNALTESELNTVVTHPFTNERLSNVRDIFVFSCYCGLAYVDVKQLRRSDIITGIDGEQWITSKRQKTKTATRIPLLAPALQIIGKYKDHPQCALLGRVLPVLSNQKMNAYLKEIADICGIAKNLTFHLARHTFATTVTLSNGVPIETVSKMLGHRSIRTTQHYARIVDIKISHDMQLLRKKLGHGVSLP